MHRVAADSKQQLTTGDKEMSLERTDSIERDEGAVWTIEGYEGRFLEWGGDSWEAFDYRNYRHRFSPPQPLGRADVGALREASGFPVGDLSGQELVHTAPDTLRAMRSKARQP
jgi:hypothetical protein